jgi:galactoside O-acetyltransferase
MAFLENEQVMKLGFKKLGQNVLISDKASIYGADKICIGDNCRIDDFAILSAGKGGIEIGKFVHISPFASITGKEKITMEDFSGISSRVCVFSSSGNFDGELLNNPTIASETIPMICGEVYFEKYALVGAGSVVLPNVRLGEGCVVGALSLVKSNLEPFKIYAGSPAKFIKERVVDVVMLKEMA